MRTVLIVDSFFKSTAFMLILYTVYLIPVVEDKELLEKFAQPG